MPGKKLVHVAVTISRTYYADLNAIKRDFRQELLDDGIDLNDTEKVIAHAWENGVSEPYFGLQDEEEDVFTIGGVVDRTLRL